MDTLDGEARRCRKVIRVVAVVMGAGAVRPTAEVVAMGNEEVEIDMTQVSQLSESRIIVGITCL